MTNVFITYLFSYILPARRYMQARVLVMALCLSVTNRSPTETAERIELGYCMEASFVLSYIAL